jgi:hypothetical protein
MSRTFGWDLPAGCSQRDIDQAFGEEEEETDAQYIARLEKENEKYRKALQEISMMSSTKKLRKVAKDALY